METPELPFPLWLIAVDSLGAVALALGLLGLDSGAILGWSVGHQGALGLALAGGFGVVCATSMILRLAMASRD
jgi:hypothetical protein